MQQRQGERSQEQPENAEHKEEDKRRSEELRPEEQRRRKSQGPESPGAQDKEPESGGKILRTGPEDTEGQRYAQVHDRREEEDSQE